jgi:DeoR/GlpR family transcriptional regulator of sugar metabolism
VNPAHVKRREERLAARQERVDKLLAFAIREMYFTVEEAAQAVGISPITAGRHLKELAQAGRLKRRVVRTHVRHVEFELIQ